MTYYKLIELYKKDQLDEGMKQQVAADIEKHEAISDYLFDKEEQMDLLHVDEAAEQSDFSCAGDKMSNRNLQHENKEAEFTQMVSRKIKCTFIKMGACMTIVSLAVVLFVIFLLPKVVDYFYYDPGKARGISGNQIGLDYCVYTELCMPGYNRDSVSVQDRGYGVYDIMILQNMSYNKSVMSLSGRIERGKLTLYDPNVLQRPAVNVFAWYQMQGNRTDSLTDLIDKKGNVNHCSAGNAVDAAQALHELDDQEMYLAYVSLDRMMSYEEFMEFLTRVGLEKQIGSIWCAVCTADDAQTETGKNSFLVQNLGFQCTFSYSHALDWDQETYPNLVLWNRRTQDGEFDSSLEADVSDEAFMKTHFTSMLRYMADQEEFLKMQEPWSTASARTFQEAAAYVEKNGLTVYGFAGVGSKKALLSLNQEKEVYEIYTQKLRG